MNSNRLMIRQNGRCKRGARPGDYVQLFKVHLCLYICLSTILGYVTAAGRFSVDAGIIGILVLVLALGSAALNNIQDREYDLSFARTANRTLPRKRIPLTHAIVPAVFLITTGLWGLYSVAGRSCLIIGLLAVVAYNGLYTPLKKITPLAFIPGTLSGALPALIGWTAAGSDMNDPTILMIMGILMVWQVPHTLMILIVSKDRQIGHGGLRRYPCLTDLFPVKELKLQVLIWTNLYSLGILFFLLQTRMDHVWGNVILSVNAMAIPIICALLFYVIKRLKPGLTFAVFNFSMLVFLGTGICDKIFI